MMAETPRDSVNPYEASALYEPARAAGPKMPRVLVAHGRISPEERRRAALLAADLSPRDVREFVYGCVLLFGFSSLLMMDGLWNPRTGLWLSAIPLGIIAALVSFTTLSYYVAYRRTLREVAAAQAAQGETTFVRQLSDDGVACHLNGFLQEAIPWQLFKRARTTPDLIVLVRSEPREYLALPRSHFASAADWLLCEQAVKHFVRVTRPG